MESHDPFNPRFNPTQRGASRRQMLKSLGLGVMGGAFATLLQTKPAHAAPVTLNSNTEVIFDAPIDPSGNTTAIGQAYYANGMMCIQVAVQSSGNTHYDLQFIDVHNQQVALRLQDFFNLSDLPTTPFKAPVTDGKAVYALSGANVYIIDVNGVAVQISKFSDAGDVVISNPILYRSNLCFLASSGNVYCYNLLTQQVTWTSQMGANNSAAYLNSKGNLIYAVALNGYAVIDADSGNQLNITTPPVPPGPFSLSADKVIVAGSDNVLRAVDTSSGQVLWQYPASSSLNAPLAGPVYYNSQVLLADGAGILHIIDEATGQQVTQVSIPAAPSSSYLFLENGIVYLALGGSNSLVIWAYDLTQKQAITYTSSTAGAFMGVQNGVCYFTHQHGANLMGVNFTGHAHGLTSESVLIEDYVSAQGNRTPSYRTHLLFVDSNYNPRPNNSVKVWASDPCTIIYGSNSYNVDSGTPVWLNTDASGEIAIVVSPDDIHCPALYIWDTYMYTGEAVVIYPDNDVSNTLSNVQGADMTNAKDFSGQPLLPTGYSGPDSLANGIRSSMAGSSGVGLAGLKQRLIDQAKQSSSVKIKNNQAKNPKLGADANTYLAYPNSTPNMVYFPDSTADSSRPYQPANPTNWTLSLTSGGACYNCTNLNVSSAATTIHWRDLEKKVVHGAENVVHIAVNVAEKVVHTITTDAANVYTLTVDSVEAAFAVVASTLKSVIGDIKRAIQWLAYLFNWHDMLATMNTIVNTITTRKDNFTSWLDNEVHAGIGQVHTFFTNLEGTITGAFDSIIAKIGGNTVQSQQIDNNNPQGIYGQAPNNPQNKGQSYSQSRWMTSKVNDNAGQATQPSGNLSADNDIVTTIQTLFQNVGTILADPKFDKLPGDLLNMAKSFGTLFADPTKFISHSMADILSIIRDTLVLLIQVLDAILETLLAQATTIINYGWSFLTTPLQIPVISNLWSDIGAGQLTMLNLIALTIAIPTTIIDKIVGVSTTGINDPNPSPTPQPGPTPPHPIHGPRALAKSGQVGGAGNALLDIALLFSAAIYATLDGISDYEDLPASGIRGGVMLAETYIEFLLEIPFDSKPTDLVLGSLFYMASGLCLIESTCTFAVHTRAEANEGNKPFKEIYDHQLPGINMSFGAFMLGLSIAAGASEPQEFGGFTMLANIFSYIPYCVKMFAVGPAMSPPRWVAALIDSVSELMAAFMTTQEA